MLEGNLFSGLSADCLPLEGGDWTPGSSWEDLDLRLGSRECLLGAASLGMSFSFAVTLALVWEAGGTTPFSDLSSSTFLLPDLELPLPVFLESIVVFPRSADLRVSFCLKADLKKDNPFSSDLLSLFRAERTPTFGDRRLAIEELRTCLLSTALLSLLEWLIRGELVLELLVTLVLSDPRLSLEPSLLRLRSEVRLFPAEEPLVNEPDGVLLAAVEDGDEPALCFCWADGTATSRGFVLWSFLA